MVPAQAASTPWSQTDWSGGSGQNNWFNATKFSTSSNLASSGVGQLTISTQSEKFSNTGFETDLTGWSETTTYSQEVLGISSTNIAGYWQLNETSGSVAADSSSQDNDGSYTNVTLNNGTGPDNQPVGYWNGTNAYTNIYSGNLNSDVNGQEGTVAFWFKTPSEDVWTDGINQYALRLMADGSNDIWVRQQYNGPHIMFAYIAGGVAKILHNHYFKSFDLESYSYDLVEVVRPS